MELRSLLAVCALCLAGGCNSGQHVADPFPDAKQLRLFVEVEYPKEGGGSVLSNAAGVVLTQRQREEFEEALVIEKAPEEMAACFIPHHFFRYYDDKGRKIGEVQVCFCCSGVSASGSKKLVAGEGKILSANYWRIGRIVSELGEPTDVLCD